jgi:uncharacterized protein YcaQ
VRTVSLQALRRLAVTTQGYVSRVRRAGADEVESAIRRASCIQLDTVTAVERSHRVAIASRAGIYPAGTVSELLRTGRVIEYWAHALCLVPAEDWPLYAWARERMHDGVPWHGDVKSRYPGFEHVIELYKPAPQRRYGYYVLPFLWRDRIVGRADLKSERGEGSLVVNAFHLEPGVRHSRALDEAFDRALDRLRRIAGLERVVR